VVKPAGIDAGKGPPDALQKLRPENKRLEMERDISKAAATFFAKESE
jgi:hypothetical protein